MQLKLGDYELVFYNGGITIEKGGSTLYYNKRPIDAFIKTTYMEILAMP